MLSLKNRSCLLPRLLRRSSFHGAYRARRGSAMVFALAVLLVMMIAGMSLAATTMQSLFSAKMQRNASSAFNAAESGAENAILYLRKQSSPPSNLTAWDPFSGTQTLGTATYRVTITPDPNNPNVDLKRYVVRSQGIASTRQETVELFVQLGNFGRFAYFTDYEQSSITAGAIWFKAGEVIDGPAHSNNSNNTDFSINYNGSTTSIFKDILTSVSSTIDYNPSAPTNETTFQRVYAQGSRGFRTSVNRIELPVSSDRQKIAAWGSTSNFPTTTGVTVPNAGGLATGGIYINGDSTVTFSDTTEGWQRIVIVQGTTTTTITVKLGSNQTVITRGTTTTTLTGAPNGAIYSTGNITSLSGTIADSIVTNGVITQRNAYTIATDVVNDKGVTITGNLRYETAPDKTKDWNDPVNLRSAALGVVARDITIGSAAPSNLTLHGVMLAGGRNTADGSFSVTGYNTRAGGTLNLVGGLIQKMRGPVGTFNPSTGTTTAGYAKNYVYDRRMAVNPPPYFPTTGTYERLSFKRISAGPY
jgi:hypothetical protein